MKVMNSGLSPRVLPSPLRYPTSMRGAIVNRIQSILAIAIFLGPSLGLGNTESICLESNAKVAHGLEVTASIQLEDENSSAVVSKDISFVMKPSVTPCVSGMYSSPSTGNLILTYQATTVTLDKRFYSLAVSSDSNGFWGNFQFYIPATFVAPLLQTFGVSSFDLLDPDAGSFLLLDKQIEEVPSALSFFPLEIADGRVLGTASGTGGANYFVVLTKFTVDYAN